MRLVFVYIFDDVILVLKIVIYIGIIVGVGVVFLSVFNLLEINVGKMFDESEKI